MNGCRSVRLNTWFRYQQRIHVAPFVPYIVYHPFIFDKPTLTETHRKKYSRFNARQEKTTSCDSWHLILLFIFHFSDAETNEYTKISRRRSRVQIHLLYQRENNWKENILIFERRRQTLREKQSKKPITIRRNDLDKCPVSVRSHLATVVHVNSVKIVEKRRWKTFFFWENKYWYYELSMVSTVCVRSMVVVLEHFFYRLKEVLFSENMWNM